MSGNLVEWRAKGFVLKLVFIITFIEGGFWGADGDYKSPHPTQRLLVPPPVVPRQLMPSQIR